LETRCHYVAQAGLKLEILLRQPPKCWDYRHAPPFLKQLQRRQSGQEMEIRTVAWVPLLDGTQSVPSRWECVLLHPVAMLALCPFASPLLNTFPALGKMWPPGGAENMELDNTHLAGQGEDCPTKQQYTQELSLHLMHGLFSVSQFWKKRRG
jgi:hypothetical protein